MRGMIGSPRHSFQPFFLSPIQYHGGMTTSPSIQLLSDSVINKIAAGEVIERPASVLKELIENSLDAGAGRIEIDVVSGGKKLIRVADDGRGMSREDARMCIRRHATSKLRDADDLERIGTLGFRGEALAAIAGVARVTLTARRAEDEEAVRLSVAGGQVQSEEGIGAPPGTEIEVRNLFFNVPARRKFLRTAQTELMHLRRVFLVYALSHPGVAMRFTVDERTVYDLAAGPDALPRLRELFGAGFVDHLRAVEIRRAGLALAGWIGLPQATRSSRADQYWFINGRPAGASVLGYALHEAFQGALPKGRFPVAVLELQIDPGDVDVNVHPAKKEVRFRRPDRVKRAVREAVEHILRPEAGAEAARPQSAEPPRSGAPSLSIADLPPPPRFPYPRASLLPDDGAGSLFPRFEAEHGAPAPECRDGPWGWCRILGQAAGWLVVLETDEGLVYMDPRAAHERILYEEILKSVRKGRAPGQGLLAPEPIQLPPREAEAVKKKLSALKDLGFGISDFGGNSFLVDALPATLGFADAAAVLREIADDLAASSAPPRGVASIEESLIRSACRAAVAGRSRLTLREIEHLVITLAAAQMPYTSPSGKPTLVFVSAAELERKFGRR
jgi:DNA mismatch repair protein MutL